ncbi:adenomatous polyposis coli homolog isoform X1 [Xenopus laevis]|uniref:Adenomatous polyposis coli homolog isoform X1 n=2 Tax=Xenopus laevis TaxID=8355 RepID=A0A1L8HR21_XENLA|nr:adenomatous polyposis coli homolog isoform X1 [Xenopus laevis]XP_018099813.1 adenomatous polyposis coli homolog isoform X1 [Xenopus laevis]XP_018099814.1 adenomatous polyposis coli homolog isoform X1 [Xenopus laevis]XP_018099815.1 adenomatous polyposis coli homolog isoform X1 [Xenopus laevis]XP_018099816.1 adenomatous polyposis coli homolog isoform X1 [Xenopus laevis]OCT98539.1 hypothetical protein XELAEV_18010775mg [Xenopus laevis]
MAAASYDQLLKQVEALKMENTNLRQELEDNSNHLTKLESEASNMKDVLKQLQGSIEDEPMASSGQIDLLERLKDLNLDSSNFPAGKTRPKMSMRSYGSREGSLSGHSGECSPVPVGSCQRRGLLNGSQESTGYLEEIEKERLLLIAEHEKEEKEKRWYYAQLQNLTKRIDGLPLTENFSLQTDMTRRQLEYEARQIRAAMEEQLGTCQDMEKRVQTRVGKIQQLEEDILRIRQLLQTQVAEAAERTPQSKHEAACRDAEKLPDGQGTSEITTSSNIGSGQGSSGRADHDTTSVMSSNSTYSVPRRLTSHLGTKVEMVYSLLSMLGTHDKDDMSRTLLAMSSSQDSCIAMRQSGCLPLLIQLLHGNDKDSVLLGNSRGSKEARARASAALHNIIHSQPDDKRGRREIRVLHLLEQIRAYCETCWEWQEAHEQGMDQDKNPMPAPVDHQICPAVCVLMKLSFDEEHRHAMNELGGLQAIAELLHVDCEMYGLINDHYSVTLRRYAGMALTNLTFGDVANKATLCSMKSCMRALVAQLKSESEDLQQVIASVLRNLSWRADVNSKKTLREVGSVKALTECALDVKKESTLKSVLSALWNLSAHCTENKADICSVDGALAFLVGTLTYRSQTNTLAIIESGGGILRNVSSLIATNEDHRQILRENNCLQTLLQHLKSHSLTIVSNACGTLWNLSARNAKDQEALWDMGAVSMLKNLIHSKHKMIAMGSAAALRNLMANRPAKYKDANIMSPGSSVPSLHVRKQKALEAELDAQHLSETFDNIDNLSPKTTHRNKQRHKQNLCSEYALDSSRHDDSICRSDNFSLGNLTVLSPYINATVLPGSSSPRPTMEGNRPEKDRERTAQLSNYHSTTEISGNSSKRIGIQLSTTAQISKVMDEVSNIHLVQEDMSSGSASEMHSMSDERASQRKSSSNHPHSNPFSFTKGDGSTRGCPVAFTKMEYKMASNDSLNSVSSTDGYGKRGQVKPSVESYSEDDESKFFSYGQYPAGLAHKIHSANYMDDNDTELDTPINYSLKYSDEQLNSGRQSPTQNERWSRPKHIIDSEMKQSEQRQPRTTKTTYSSYTENKEEKHKKFPPHFNQSENVPAYTRSRGANNQVDQSRVSSNLSNNSKASKPHCQVDDYDDDKTTNFSERYSEEEQQEDETERQNKYNIKAYASEEHHGEQPIDYSRKYSTDVPSSAQKPSFPYSNNSSKQKPKKEQVSSNSNTPTPSPNSNRQNQLHPNSAQSRPGLNRPKQIPNKPPSINQETIQTYCVEDTPICFSRGSSLSSLSSAEDEIEGRERNSRGQESNNTLQITEPKEISAVSKDGAVNETRSSVHHTRTKNNRLQTSNISPSDSSRHKSVEFSSGAKSPSKSGAQTPKSPPEHYVQETPLMFSRCTSVSSLDSFESHSIASSIASSVASEHMISGIISPSDLPDSPGQTMPPSRSKTPPPPQTVQAKKDGSKPIVPDEERGKVAKTAVHSAIQRVQVLQEADTLLHFATESTPDGFSCASSLSALSLDEPYIQKDVQLKIMPPVLENDQGNKAEPEKEFIDNKAKKEDKRSEQEKDMLDDTDDDIDILEECIISAMPRKPSRKNKKVPQPTPGKPPPPVARKPSQLPVYKLLSSQNRLQTQKHVNFTHSDDMPRVYCVEGTPINFSTATSLSDLTIESPPSEPTNDQPNTDSLSTDLEKRDTIPTEGRSTDDTDASKPLNPTTVLDEDKAEEGDILAECIHSAMPKGKSHKPYRVKKIMDQINHTSAATSSGNSRSMQETDKNKPTSPVKPMPQSIGFKERLKKNTELKLNPNSENQYCDPRKPSSKKPSKVANEKIPNNEERTKGFAFDSPHHYTPIEGTPYCFSRNDSLSSLDFEDDDIDLSKEKAELRKEKGTKDTDQKVKYKHENRAINPMGKQDQTGPKSLGGRDQPKALVQKPTSFSSAAKGTQDRGGATDEKMENFAIENTPVCFSRNSSLSSLSDIDQENNNKETEPLKQTETSEGQLRLGRPQTSGYAPKSFHVEDTPVCFSRNSSLSSLSIDSEDDLLQECISSAMPKKRKPSKIKNEGEKSCSNSVGGILEPDLSLDLRDLQSPVSENALSPDSENFDWKAIQEGANSIVSRLHQAAAGSLSRQGSSDSDSILSLKSGISFGSPFHLTSDKEEKIITSNKGPKILKSGDKSALENKKIEEEPKGIKGGKKIYKSLITGKSRSSSDFSSHCKQSVQTNMPSISRGRTMIHIPGVRASSPSTSPVSKKGPVFKNVPSKSPNENQSSSSSPKGTKPLKSESLYGSRQPSTPSGSSKGNSRSGSKDSASSRPSPQPLSRPLQSPGRNSISPGKNGISPPNKFSQLPRTSSPSTASTKSSGSGRMSYTSAGRQLSQPNLSKQSGLPKTPSSIPRSESASKGLNQNANTGSNKKVELSRMSSTKSSGSESDRSERPALVRQSTFIKEAPSPTLRRKLEESASFESLSSSSRADSPTRSQTQTPALSPSLPDMALSTHSIQAGGWRKMPPNLNPATEHGDSRRRHDISRSHSESPSRLPVTRSGTWKREHSKHSSSLPRVSTWRRTGSSSSILSASSESSEKVKSEDEKQQICSFQGPRSTSECSSSAKGTWRKIRESEILETPSNGSSSTIAESNCSLESKTLFYQMAPAVSKTEDVWVRIEDCPINNPRSGRSPTGNSPPVIDTVLDQGQKEEAAKDCHSRHNSGNGNVSLLENRQKSFIKLDGLDTKGTDPKSLKNNQQETNENTVAERTPFSSSSSSKHSSPSGTVAARVTPFNYNPSPRKSNSDNSTSRPSQIPTPVTTSTKKPDSKTETDCSGSQSPRRHSGSYLVTSV